MSMTGCLCEVPIHQHTRSMANKQEELAVNMQLQGYDLNGITEIKQHSSHNETTTMAGYVLFKDSLGW